MKEIDVDKVEEGPKNFTGASGVDQFSLSLSSYDEAGPEAPPDANHLAIEHGETQPNVLTKTLSYVRTRDSAKDPGPAPDRGFKAWSHAVLVHLVIFNTWGYINSFGLFQTYYVRTFHVQPSAVSWVGSLQIFLTFFIGTFSGRAADAGFFKLFFVIGSTVQLLGIFMTSLSTKYWHLLLAQGICTGVGNGLVFVPSLSVLSTYFVKNRSLALGFAASGSSTGGLVFPAIAERLLPQVGFAWAVRVMGFVMMGTMLTCAIFLKPRLPPRKTGPIVEWSAFSEPTYLLIALCSFLFFWAVYFAFYYLGSFARDNLGASQATSINLLLTMNGVGVTGRVIPNYIADRVGPLNVFIPSLLVTSILLYCWIAVQSIAGMWAFAVAYGSFGASIQGLFPAVVSSLTNDPKKAGVRLGMAFTIVSFAALSGEPLAGALIQKDRGKYLYGQIFGGSCMFAAFTTSVFARYAMVGRKLWANV